MNKETGEIRKLKNDEYRKGWIKLNDEQAEHLMSLPRKVRREEARRMGLVKSGRWGWR